MAETLLDRFLRYVRVETQSDSRSSNCPSTPGQWDLLKMLQRELEALGVQDVRLTRYGYVIGTIPATTKQAGIPTVAFLAHVDTAPDFSGRGVKPRVHRNYDGRAILYPDNRKLRLDTSVAPELRNAIGKDIVTTSGMTLLGADDKAGVAVVMTLANELVKRRSLKHGAIRICFTPDEEIGRGVEKLDLRELDANVAYTLDGESPGAIGSETFSADHMTVVIRGVAAHPGEAKAKGLVNAVHLAGKLIAALPREHCAPETTSGAEGFIHPLRFEGNADQASVEMLLRDFELAGLAQKRAIVLGIARALQNSQPGTRITCRVRKQYRNMAYWLEKDKRPVDLAWEAIAGIGVKPFSDRIRGGTDGSRLTELGLPTPNLFCGAHNAHGPLEWVAVQDMELAVKACLRLVQVWERKGKGFRGFQRRG